MSPDALTSTQNASTNDVLKALCQVDELADSQFMAFRRFYHEMTLFSHTGDVSVSINRPGLSSHAAVLQAISKLKSLYNKELGMVWQLAFPNCWHREREHATMTTVRLAFMVNPCSKKHFPKAYRIENEPVFPLEWLPNQTFVQFFHTAFPTEPLNPWYLWTEANDLRAWKLKQKFKIQIRPTNDLAEHLVYDSRTKTLSVFHQVEYLKAQIRYTASRDLGESVETSFSNGTLPPQLLLETLYSIYYILFPVATDLKSADISRRLTRANGSNNLSDSSFDSNLLIYDGLIRQLPFDFKLIYWAKRLNALQAVLDGQGLANQVISWFERHTSERNAFTVAILGLFLTTILGFLSLVVGVAQLAVAISA